MGDVLDIAIIARKVGRTSVTFTIHAFKDDVECLRSTFVTVTRSIVDHKAIAIPDDLRRALIDHQARCGGAPAAAEPQGSRVDA